LKKPEKHAVCEIVFAPVDSCFERLRGMFLEVALFFGLLYKIQVRLFQNSESFERATLDVHGEKSQVIIERLVIFLQKPISKATDF
jgi:hypothetical protein